MKLVEGLTYSHEHMKIDLSGQKNNEDCKLDIFDETVIELLELKEKGVRNIIEVTNRGIGRDVEYIKKVSEKTGINILCSTGFYKEPFLPEEFYKLSEKELTVLMKKEILQGIDDTGIEASIIGEIGTSKDIITEAEEKLFRASAVVSEETGTPIITHTTLGTCGLLQINLFEEYNINLDKIIISHVALKGDLDYILRLIDKGANVAFDTIGKENYQPDSMRIDFINELCKRGLSDKILISMDITRKSNFKTRGGIGYAYAIDNFLPKLREAGVKEKDIDNMTKNNIRRILS